MPFFHRSYNDEAIASPCLNVATALTGMKERLSLFLLFPRTHVIANNRSVEGSPTVVSILEVGPSTILSLPIERIDGH